MKAALTTLVFLACVVAFMNYMGVPIPSPYELFGDVRVF
jgi:hypothetical protein